MQYKTRTKKFTALKVFYCVAMISFIFLLAGCGQQENGDAHLQKYFGNLPPTEEITASLYHHEKIIDDMYKALQEKDYFHIFLLYEKYDRLFFEGEVEDKSEVYFLVGIALQEMWKTSVGRKKVLGFFNEQEQQAASSSGANNGKEKLNNKKNWLRLFLLKEENFSADEFPAAKKQEAAKTPIAFFNRIIQDRDNYFWELAAAQAIFFERLQKNISSSIYKTNINFFSWAVRHYPTAVDYEKISHNTHYFQGELKNKKNKKEQELKEATRIITVAQKPQRHYEPGIFFISSGANVVLRNRPNILFSRSLAVMQAWQTFELTQKHIGENGETWFAVKPLTNVHFTKGSYGEVQQKIPVVLPQVTFYIPASSQLHAFMAENMASEGGGPPRSNRDVKKLEQQFDILLRNHSNLTTLPRSKNDALFWNLFVLAHRQIMQQQYFAAMESSVKLLNMAEGLKKELVLMLQHSCLEEIAKRSSSLENKYTQFVKKFPRFFVTSDNNLLLHASKDTLLQLLQLNPSTVMAQYFDGIP